MHDVLAVHVAQCGRELGDVDGGLVFGKTTLGLLLQLTVQAAAGCEFEDEVYVVLIMELRQQLENILMCKVLVYL